MRWLRNSVLQDIKKNEFEYFKPMRKKNYHRNTKMLDEMNHVLVEVGKNSNNVTENKNIFVIPNLFRNLPCF